MRSDSILGTFYHNSFSLIISDRSLRKNSEVSNSEFSVLGIEQNGKLGVEKPRKTDSLRSSIPENS